MNTAQAKEKISIAEYLQSNGYQPVKQRNVSFWYLSPFRNEKTASFVVNVEKNTFKDWGSGERGTIIDLVMQLNTTNVSGALKILEKYVPAPENSKVFSFPKQIELIPDKIISGTFNRTFHSMIVMYLASRKINETVWRNCEFLFEYSYRNSKYSGFPFKNLAWKNDKGGYELRGGRFKSCLLYKDITTIPGTSDHLNIFEGFFDYLSALTFYQKEKLAGTSIVLNSVALVKKILPLLPDYGQINAYLDNDQAGEAAYRVIEEAGKQVTNKSKEIYPNFKDFNEFLVFINKKKININLRI